MAENSKERIEKIRLDFKKASENSGYTDTSSIGFFKRNILQLSNAIITSDTNHFVYRNDKITNYLNTVLKKIIAGNNQLNKTDFKIYTAQTNEVNAANYSQGVLFVNLGIIYRCNNEDQLAFVICHEMSHDYMDHVIKGIKKRNEIYNSSTLEKEMSQLSKEKFNRYKRFEEVSKKYLAKYQNTSREYELQADSLGLAFLKNTGYEQTAAYNQLLILDSCDKFYFTTKIPFTKIFNFDDLKFDEEWLKDEEQTDWGNNVNSLNIPDSLKSHPDAKIRADKLLHSIKVQKTAMGVLKNDFGEFKKLALYEGLEKYINEGMYCLSLYNSLQLLNETPGQPYLILNSVRCLIEMSFFKQHHLSSQIIDIPDKNFPLSYNELLNFINNINDKMALNLAEQLLKKHKDIFSIVDPLYGYLESLMELKKQTSSKNNIIAETYSKKYADTYYLNELKKRINLIHD
ncbi:MAG: M48 family metalloprotease [Bacteroidetes bacterium]|nr:M48 family metalloprotease [Bacteroidota bacterium]